MSPDPIRIHLDPAEAEHDKARRHYRLNVVAIPAARVIGSLLLLLCVLVHNVYVLQAFDATAFLRFAAGLLAYALLSWAVLAAGYARVTRVDLAGIFLILDIVAWTFAIYYSGGERSWLFFLMILRAGDQRLGTTRWVLASGHVSVACYGFLILYLALVEQRPIAVSVEVAKLVILYAFNLYLATTAVTADAQRRKLVAAIRVARELLARGDRAQAGRRESEESYRTLVEAVNEPILTATLDGRITGVNRALEEALGYPRAELIGRHYSMLTTPGVVKESEERLRRAAAGEILEAREVVGVHKDGTLRDFEVRTALIRDETGQPTGVVGIYRDIRKSKQAEQALQRARDFAEEASRAKSQFLANMSHELRTPLNSIIGFSKVLLNRLDGELTPRQEAYVRSVHQSGSHLLGVINSVLDLARVEAGKHELARDLIDVRALVEECLESSRPLAGSKPLSLQAELAPDLPPLAADRTRVKQILLNLLGNAVKFTAAGRVLVSVDLTAEGMRFSVADTGMGIAEDELPRLFEPFHRPDTPLARESTGTGLGLAISKQFVELHGGRIWVESREKQGSTFRFVLPLTPLG